MVIDQQRWQQITGPGFAAVAAVGGIAALVALAVFVMYLYQLTS